MARIIVAGSINMDLVVETDEIPGIGETVAGNSFSTIPGGKGANQAVAIAKQGGDCIFLGKVGNDDFGANVLKSMQDAGINTNLIKIEKGSTGVSIINVDKNGANNIVYIAGANNLVDEDYIDENKNILDEAEYIVMQNEIPEETINHILKICKDKNIKTILNPAPARSIDDEIIKLIDILVPNEHELARISGQKVESDEDVRSASQKLLDMGLKEIVVTLGARGVFYKNKDTEKFYDAYKTKVVDTTAAGDSFIGGFVNSLIQTKDIGKSIDFGQRVAAIAIGKVGAQTSIPTKEEVEEFDFGG
jgi:ribokinase